MPLARPTLCSFTAAVLAIAVALLAGCRSGASGKQASDKPVVPLVYPPLPPAENLPDFMKGTLYELAVTLDTEPMVVSGFGLVANLRDTGDTNVPMVVREYILRDMMKRGVPRAEQILNDKRVAIVQVDGIMPPGIRRGEQFDVQVSAIAGSYVTSLAHGRLFQCELSPNGANDIRPGNPVNVMARSQGEIFVNPAYALLGTPEPASQAAASLRMGVVLNGGQAMKDRPMRLRLRNPQFSMAQFVENRIDAKFQNRDIAGAENEAVIHFVIPPAYAGDPDHFRNLVTHLYADARPEMMAILGQRLVAAARKPEAPLMDISYCLEGLGEGSHPYIDTLLTHPDPAVVYAAARAGAFTQHPGAVHTLMEIARQDGHAFQVEAVKTLGRLPGSPMIDSRLRQVLEARDNAVRIEAYRSLVRHKDASILSRVVDERFVLDIVPGEGAPLIYVARTGVPRIALIGRRAKLQTPLTYAALENRFMISSSEDPRAVQLYYRKPGLPRPINMRSTSDLAEVLARLGGDGAEDEIRLDFSYSEVVSILQSLTERGKLAAADRSGQRLAASMQLQEMPYTTGSTYAAPVLEAPDATASRAMSPEELPDLQPDAADEARISGPGSRSRPQ